MKQALYLLSCTALLSACSEPVVTSKSTVPAYGNTLQVASGTLNKGRFVVVSNTQKTWAGKLKGGKEKWNARRAVLQGAANTEIERICGDWFYQKRKGPIYNMLDNDETMGGVAPALGVSVAMVAYLAAEAATLPTNIPVSVYMEFACESDEKKKK